MSRSRPLAAALVIAVSTAGAACQPNKLQPVEPPPPVLPAVPVALASGPGAERTCATLADRSVRCWGAMDTTDPGEVAVAQPTPTDVPDARGAASLAIGDGYTCAAAGGSVICSGRIWASAPVTGAGGSTGAQTLSRWQPVGLDSVSALGGGSHDACGVTTAGGVQCWGAAGPPPAAPGAPPPAAAVPELQDATAVVAGFAHVCALRRGGTVSCWGDGSMGQTGDPNLASSAQPVTVVGVAEATAIAAGGYHTCAIVAGGRVVCWGFNPWGQLGATTDEMYHPQVVEVAGVAGAAAIAAGAAHTCAIVAGAVLCWGFNGNDELGTAPAVSQEHSPAPQAVPAVSGAIALASGSAHTCALLTSGQVWCWGSDRVGELGSGATTTPSPPVQVTGW